jgi:hypothetical protein
MTSWREKAFELLPELGEKITDPDMETPFRLWFELWDAFRQAYDASPRDESLISRIYAFAGWCMTAQHDDSIADELATATCVSFFEHIPQHLAARDDMPRWIPYQDFIGREQVFRYGITEEEFVALKQHFYKHRHDFVPRPAI